MSERVLKYDVPVDDLWHSVGGGPVIHVACQRDSGVVQVWTREWGSAYRARAVRVFATGQPLPEGMDHLGSALAADGGLVWHVFASRKIAEDPS